ncbi:MAG: hypothetical protein IT364_21040 [Candidatus Hydrogenedentes bacterium]|nr:hypothetical protein [Candidatus Hydrogenedentota bacterium]
MAVSRRVQLSLVSIFLLVIFGEGIAQALIELGRGERPQALDLFTRTPNAANLRAYETEMEKTAWSAKALRPVMQYARYAGYGDLGEKALIGRDGWLFYRPGVTFLLEPWPQTAATPMPQEDPLEAIVAFRDALAERGIALLVVPAPGKPSVYPERLSGRVARTRTDVHGPTRTFMERLGEAGVSYVDLFTLYREARIADPDAQLYLARDTHWSPAGLRMAASAVADRIRAEGWVAEGAVVYEEKVVTIQRQGDVLRMVDTPRIAAEFELERVDCQQIIETATGEPYHDDPASPVLVLGDSFLRIYERDEPGSAGFIAHLAREMKQSMASIVSDGGASTLVRQELQRKPELLRGKKLVIWEFVERDLRFGMEGWKLVSLPNTETVAAS